MRVVPFGLWVLALSMAGCVDPDVGRDRDGDGFRTAELGGDDCDDANPNINPAASEACGNNVDDNCDGVIDDAGVGQVDWYIDNDNDGYPSDIVFQSCSPPEGSFADLSRGVDCDDNNNTINPGADEIYYDGVDQDCAGGDDNDADGDGHSAVAQGGDDCDDADPLVNPSAEEVCNNGVDDDCDGGPGPCTLGAVVEVEEQAEIVFPYALSVLRWADLSGDGVEDLITVSAQDDVADDYRIRVYDGATLASNATPIVTFLTPSGDRSWDINVHGDFNNDGILDLVIWSYDAVHIFDSPLPVGVRALSAASHTLIHSPEDDESEYRFSHVSVHTNRPNGAADIVSVFGLEMPQGEAGRTWIVSLDDIDIDLSTRSHGASPPIADGPYFTFADGSASVALRADYETSTIGETIGFRQFLPDLEVLTLTSGHHFQSTPELLAATRHQELSWNGERSDVYLPILWSEYSSSLSMGVRVSRTAAGGIYLSQMPRVYPPTPTVPGERYSNLGSYYCDLDSSGSLDWLVNQGQGPITALTNYSVVAYLDVETDDSTRMNSDVEFVGASGSALAAVGCEPDSPWVAIASATADETYLIRRVGI